MRPVAIGYRVVIELDPIEEKSAGGIIMTANVRETDEICMTVGTVDQIGPFAFCGNDGGPGWPAWYKVGDRVIFAEHSGRFWEDKATGKKYRIMNDRDVIAKVEEAGLPLAVKTVSAMCEDKTVVMGDMLKWSTSPSLLSDPGSVIKVEE